MIENIDPIDQAIVNTQMVIAAKIDDGIKAKGWTYKEFGKRIERPPQVIEKWLSGTNNFTLFTLIRIEQLLGINILIHERK